MSKFFTLPEAERLLPEVEGHLRTLIQRKTDYENAEKELNVILQRVMVAGGMVPPRERIAELRKQKDAAARGLKRTLERIQELGCQLKDIEMGLVDFPTLYKDREVYFCWKLGEAGIAFWHHVEDGFRGRRPIDDEFLANHRGDG